MMVLLAKIEWIVMTFSHFSLMYLVIGRLQRNGGRSNFKSEENGGKL